MAEFNESQSAEVILNNYKAMTAECQQIATKVSELNMDKDEHKLVIDMLKDTESERKAFRLVGGVLIERTVGDILPEITQTQASFLDIIAKLEATLQTKDDERRLYKEKYGIMTQEERERMLKQAQSAKS